MNPFQSPTTRPRQRHLSKPLVRFLLVIAGAGIAAWSVPNWLEYRQLSALAEAAHPAHRLVAPTEYSSQVGIAIAKICLGTAILIAALDPRQR